MFDDRRATFRSYQTVKETARKARERGGVADQRDFNVVEYIDHFLAPALGNRFELNLFTMTEGQPKAHVNFNSKTGITKLNVSKLIWNQGKFNVPDAKYVLAHELGHIFMHRHDKLAFSNNNQSILKSLPDEDRAEPQADLFADIFLVHDDLIEDYHSAQNIQQNFRVPSDCANRRMLFVNDKKRRNYKGELLGDLCRSCGSMTLVRDNTVTKCTSCGVKFSDLL